MCREISLTRLLVAGLRKRLQHLVISSYIGLARTLGLLGITGCNFEPQPLASGLAFMGFPWRNKRRFPFPAIHPISVSVRASTSRQAEQLRDQCRLMHILAIRVRTQEFELFKPRAKPPATRLSFRRRITALWMEQLQVSFRRLSPTEGNSNLDQQLEHFQVVQNIHELVSVRPCITASRGNTFAFLCS